MRLNTNESPVPPPEAWRDELAAELGRIEFNRYPDRQATALRAGLAELHGVSTDEVFCANGSNEVLQCLLLAYGGPGRRAVLFEPTYALHAHIARLTGTEVVAGGRRRRLPDRRRPRPTQLVAEARPELTFLCSPNNPTGRAETPELVTELVGAAPGLVVVDEAYGQFAPWSALALRTRRRPAGRRGLDTAGLVVVRTFSKTWSMAAARLGYLVADPEVVAGVRAAVLPYHLSTLTQAAGLLALRYRTRWRRGWPLVAEERGRLSRRPGRPRRRDVAVGRQLHPLPAARPRRPTTVWAGPGRPGRSWCATARAGPACRVPAGDGRARRRRTTGSSTPWR